MGFPSRLEDIHALVDQVGVALEIVGISVIALGAVVAAVLVWRQRGEFRDFSDAVERYRSLLGRGILLGLEFLVAADIIATVAAEPTFGSVGVLAVIVLVRTFLSLSLGVEIEGRFPWQRDRKMERAAHEPPAER